MCERLSPWVLQKEIRSVMNDIDGTSNLLDPEWRKLEYKNAVLWWNLGRLLSFTAPVTAQYLTHLSVCPSFVVHALSSAILVLVAGKF